LVWTWAIKPLAVEYLDKAWHDHRQEFEGK
jgi:hypothetical protein